MAGPTTTRQWQQRCRRPIGGDGIDIVDGNQGNDTALLGAGNDTLQWDPGDGSDMVEGQAGVDTLVFNGSTVNENMTFPPTASGCASSATSPT